MDHQRRQKRTRLLTELVRVNVLVAERSGLSRRGADAAIVARRVTSDGRPVLLGERLEGNAALELDGVVLTPRRLPDEPNETGTLIGGAPLFAWYKPAGVTTTHADPFAAITLPQALEPLFGAERAVRMLSIGRLDRESEGLLLLTEERRLVSLLAHPRAGLRRGYSVSTRFTLGAPEFDRLKAGIRLTDGWARALEARAVHANDALPLDVRNGDDDPGQWSYIALGEGRHHEVRRLYGAVGHPVLRLIRLSFGPVSLRELAPGEMRDLRSDERNSLKAQLAAAAQPGSS